MFGEQNIWILVQLLGAFLLFSNQWIPSPFNLVVGLILILLGGKKYRDIKKIKKQK